MRKYRLTIGWIVYRTTAAETGLIGGMGICDECNRAAEYGYLVPVLNHWQCPECFREWKRNARYYPSDVPFEQRNIDFYESRIPVEIPSFGTDANVRSK